MSYLDLQAEVDRRAADQIMDRLLDRSVERHQQKSYWWRDCCCDWCSKKREATVSIGWMLSPKNDPHFEPFSPDQYFATHGLDRHDWEDRREMKKAAREHLRRYYRGQLMELAQE